MTQYIVIAVIVLLILGIIVFPFINKLQFKRMPFEQQVRILMKEAKGLDYFKNITDGSSGTLVYIKNKRKIYYYPWVLSDGIMLCTRKDLFEKWDYPEDKPDFLPEEKTQALTALESYNDKNLIKMYLDL
ncbi:MAG: hypothetical protein K6C14_01175 [Eubacterium sp.]|nr:hypothetical protein [Eubacterium sp.]